LVDVSMRFFEISFRTCGIALRIVIAYAVTHFGPILHMRCDFGVKSACGVGPFWSQKAPPAARNGLARGSGDRARFAGESRGPGGLHKSYFHGCIAPKII
jgi:hypothetical protein